MATGNQLGSGRTGAKRRQKEVNTIGSALNKPTLRRLARRGGVKRINAGVYDEAPLALKEWLKKMVCDACTYTEHSRRATVTINDILMALKRNGVTLYGFAMTEKRRRLTLPLQRRELETAAARLAASARAATPPPPQERTCTAGVEAGAEAQETADSPSSPAPTPERALDIQLSLSAYRDTIEGQESPDRTLPTAVNWVRGHLQGRGKPVCSMEEFGVVLESLEKRDAIHLDGTGTQRTLWFV